MMAQREYQARQRQPFDAKILCLKLEAHQRELERAQGRCDRRDGQKKSVFIPQTAARQFAATATPRTEECTTHILQFDQPPPVPSIPHGLTEKRMSRPVPRGLSEKRLSINPKQFYAALSMGMSEIEATAAVAHANETWHAPRESHNTSRQAVSAKRVSRLPRARPEGNDAGSAASRPQTARDAKRCSYRPGDAQKRRADDVKTSFAEMALSPNLTTNWSRVPDYPAVPYHVSSIADHDLDLAVAPPARPQLAPPNRPDWSQCTQDEDDMRNTLRTSRLHFWTKPDSRLTVPGEDQLDARRSRSDCRGRPRPEWTTDSDSDHMISDAVKVIKKQEHAHRRKSIMALFRKAS